MAEETTVEPLLTTYLREAVEALRVYEKQGSEILSETERLRDYQPDGQAYAHECEVYTEDLTTTRAALAFFERLAKVEVCIGRQYSDRHARIFAEVRTPVAQAVSLLHVWQPEDADQAEAEAVAHLAAVLECRKRNDGEGV